MKWQQGWTLLETLIVIIMLCILAAVILPSTYAITHRPPFAPTVYIQYIEGTVIAYGHRTGNPATTVIFLSDVQGTDNLTRIYVFGYWELNIGTRYAFVRATDNRFWDLATIQQEKTR